jgi:hypothetical protein
MEAPPLGPNFLPPGSSGVFAEIFPVLFEGYQGKIRRVTSFEHDQFYKFFSRPFYHS